MSESGERIAFNLRTEYIWLACGIPEREISPRIHHVREVLWETQYLKEPIDPADGYVILNAVEVATIIQNPNDWLIFQKLHKWVVQQQIAPKEELRQLALYALEKLYASELMRMDWQEMITPDYVKAWQDIGLKPGFDEYWTWYEILDQMRSRL